MKKENFSPAAAAGTVENNSSHLQVCQGVFSYFKPGVWNTKPEGECMLQDVYEYVAKDGAKETTDAYRKLMATPGSKPDDLSEYKRKHFSSVTFSAIVEGGRRMEHVRSHSQLLCIDFDHLGVNGEPQMWRERLKADRLFMTAISFVSPSADGLKWIISIDTMRATHKEWFEAVSMYLKERYGLKADRACSDITRTCFLPHDPYCYLNPAFTVEEMNRGMMEHRNEILKNGGKLADAMACRPEFLVSAFDPKAYLEEQRKRNPVSPAANVQQPTARCERMAPDGEPLLTDLEKARLIARLVVDRGLDIAPDYQAWFRIAAALAHGLGEDGRQIFHDVSALFAGYTRKRADCEFDKFLVRPGGIGLGTFFNIVWERAGIGLKEELQKLRGGCAATEGSATLKHCTSDSHENKNVL